MPIDRLRPSYTLTEDRLEELEQVVPEAFADGKVDWDTLRDVLGEYADEEDEQVERFGLFWPGKRQARRAAAIPPKGTLVPCSGEGVNEETTRNIFIEGENLETLKLLRKAYAGKVKMIYIDPPYNTGNDFVYVDDYSEPIETYLRRTGQTDEAGELLTTNAETSGRYHSNWLSMMYPRLQLARGLLREEGVILVSIGDRELGHLIGIMDEIYGEGNQVAIFTWKSRAKPTNAGDAKYRPQKVAEYVLVYGRLPGDELKHNVLSSRSRTYPHEDEEGKYRITTILTSNRGMFQRETMRFEVGGYAPDEDFRWKAGKAIVEDLFARGRIVFNDDGVPMEKKYKKEEDEPLFPIYCFMDPDLTGTSENGKDELNELVGRNHGLDTVKPVPLLKYFCATFGDSDSVFLDFFAGSGTTAQAVLELNEEDGGTRRFVLAQFPEPTKDGSSSLSKGFSTIAEVGKERIRRVIAKMQRQNEPEEAGPAESSSPSLEREAGKEGSPGFKVLKLAPSHFKGWEAYEGDSTAELQQRFDHFESPLVEDWQRENLLVEIVLQEGFPLDSQVKEVSSFGENRLYRVSHEWCEHRLFVCLDPSVAVETAARLPAKLVDQDVFVCLDSALTDEMKMRLRDGCTLHVI